MAGMVLYAGIVATCMHAAAVKFQWNPDLCIFFVFVRLGSVGMQTCKNSMLCWFCQARSYPAFPTACNCAWYRNMVLHMWHVSHLPAASNMHTKMSVPELPGNNCAGGLDLSPHFDTCKQAHV